MRGPANRLCSLLELADPLLRGATDQQTNDDQHEHDCRSHVALMCVFGPVYGAIMGSSTLDSPERLLQMLYSAIKVPLLLGATTLLCLPAFFVVSTVAGLRDDFRASVAAILGGQAVMSVVLASLAPITAMFYLSMSGYNIALMFNALVFAVGAFAGQHAIRRAYRPLIARHARHRVLLVLWIGMYAFVGTQMGWTLRPFIGSPGAFPTFLRDDPFTNAYVEVAMIAGRALREAGLAGR